MRLVVAVAVRLDDQSLGGEEEVDAVVAGRRLALRTREAVAPAEVQERLLQRAVHSPGHVELQQPSDAGPAEVIEGDGNGVLKGAQVQVVDQFRLPDCRPQCPWFEPAGEVDQRPDQAGDGDAVADHDVGRGQRGAAVQGDAGRCLTAVLRGDQR